MPLTPREAQRLHVLTLLESGKVTSKQAAEALGNHPAAARAPAGEAAGRGAHSSGPRESGPPTDERCPGCPGGSTCMTRSSRRRPPHPIPANSVPVSVTGARRPPARGHFR